MFKWCKEKLSNLMGKKAEKKDTSETDGNAVVQSVKKISNKSRRIKKAKCKTPAQDRLRRFQNSLAVNSKSCKELLTDSLTGEKLLNLSYLSDQTKLTTSVESKKSMGIFCKQSSNKNTKLSTVNFFQNGRDSVPSKKVCDEQKNVFKENENLVHIINCYENDDVLKTAHKVIMNVEKRDNLIEQIENLIAENLLDSYYIVPDTNVFVHALAAIKSIISEDTNSNRPNLYLPYVVLQELDQLKRRKYQSTLSFHATRAINYIYKQQKLNNQRLQGQKAIKDTEHVIEVNDQDDKIINCCLQLKNQSKQVILLTHDKNLSNKASFNEIQTITTKKYFEEIENNIFTY